MVLLLFFLPFFGLLVLAAKNPIHSVLFLVLTFVNGSLLLVMLGVEFLALLFLVVYVGAVAVLFLFVVMMLDLKLTGFRQSLVSYYPVGFILILLLVTLLASGVPGWTLFGPYVVWSDAVQSVSNISAFGLLLYTYKFFPFLLCSQLLLVAMVGAILLAFDPVHSSSRQVIYRQIVRSNQLRLT